MHSLQFFIYIFLYQSDIISLTPSIPKLAIFGIVSLSLSIPKIAIFGIFSLSLFIPKTAIFGIFSLNGKREKTQGCYRFIIPDNTWVLSIKEVLSSI